MAFSLYLGILLTILLIVFAILYFPIRFLLYRPLHSRLSPAGRRIFWGFVLLVLLLPLWHYGRLGSLVDAERHLDHYQTLQGAEHAPVSRKNISVNFETGGWFYYIEYRSDPGLTYKYLYEPARGMYCSVRSSDGSAYADMQYPPRSEWVKLES